MDSILLFFNMESIFFHLSLFIVENINLKIINNSLNFK